VDAPTFLTDEDILRRIQAEYREMPGLRLTPAQAQRLWNLNRGTCDAALSYLVDRRFLLRTADGAFILVDPSSPVR
jgi:DNA-binding transcriptional LysR family regulator